MVYSYYDLLQAVLVDNDLMDKPAQLFNFDEVGVPFQHVPLRVLASKRQKHVYSVTSGNKSQISVLACSSAAGYSLPPFVICKKKVTEEFKRGDVPGTRYDSTDSGWSNGSMLERWLIGHFLPHAPSARPLLLMIDGHSSHFNPAAIERAADSGVIVLCLPPNTTHLAQPLDRCAFSCLKRGWAKKCQEYSLTNAEKLVTPKTFSAVFCLAWTDAMTINNVAASFSTTGIFPFHREAIKVYNASDLQEEAMNEATDERKTIAFLPLLAPSPRVKRIVADKKIESETATKAAENWYC